MKRVIVGRRQFLRGTGGVALGLPFLPSLMPGRAYAAEFAFERQPRFVALCTQHGGVSVPNMFPVGTPNSVPLYPGHDIRWGPLTATREGSDNRLSPVLRAQADVLTDALVAKMNVLRGFDIPFYIGHHSGGHLGNFVRSDQGPQDLTPFQTIDQLMAWSNSFYRTLDGVKERSIVTGQNFHGMSWAYSNPASKSGTIQKVAVESSSQALFNKLFVPPQDVGAPRPQPIVDRVLASYRHLRQSNRRLSTADRQRLDDHMARLDELQRKLTANTRSCGNYATPTDDSTRHEQSAPAEATQFYHLINDVIAMAFACGTSRIATVHIHLDFSDFGGNWHEEIVHQHLQPAAQTTLAQGLQKTFQGAIVDLARKLDAIEESPGVTVLDNSLVQWTQESGPLTHDAQDLAVVTFGSAAGFFKTGMNVDYRSLNPNAHLHIFGQYFEQFLGLSLRQWQATVLQAMGVPRTEFESNGRPGYGDPYYDPSYPNGVHPNVIAKASDIVPLIKA